MDLTEADINDLLAELLSRVKRISVHPAHPDNQRPDKLCVWFEFNGQINTVVYAQDALDDPFTEAETREQLAAEWLCKDCDDSSSGI
jgi:hypothetical protein